MDQLSLFEYPANQVIWQLYVDGASRNNPGPSGAGIYIVQDRHEVLRQGFFLGTCTNNQAEYIALLLGLCQIRELMATATDQLRILSDSELLVRHILGNYAVKHPALIPLYQKVKNFLHDLRYVIVHIPRSENAVADLLANEGIDQRHMIPTPLRIACGLSDLCTE